MKVYGFTSLEAPRGEMVAYEIAGGANLLDAVDILGVELELEEAYIDFRVAQRRMVAIMREEGADPYDIQAVRAMRAGDVHVLLLTLRDRRPPEVPWNAKPGSESRPVAEITG